MDNQRLIDIETKLAYQEDLVQELNKTVHLQQIKLDQLDEALRSLALRYASLLEQGDSEHPMDAKPPHY